MLTATKLEKIIELEDSLRSQYQAQLDEKSAEIERHIKETEAQKVIVEKQLEQLTKLSTASSSGKRLEQLNRELENRSKKLVEELATQKKRLKSLQKDLGEERAQVKALKQFDVAAMRKNLDASKKKLAEKTKANELLQKSLNKTKAENAEFQNKIKELETKLAELEPVDEEGAEEVAEEAAEKGAEAEAKAA
jgi:predicted nuclease with TOPRIM domain